MKKIELIAYKRDDLGKRTAKKLREEAMVPGVLYGNNNTLIHFYSPMILFRELVYTPDFYQVELNVEGDIYHCILQDIQFHPISEIITHVDFMELDPTKKVKVEIPVRFVGNSPGVQAGGRLMAKLKKVKVKALPGDLPEYIEVDISDLQLGKSVKVKQIQPENYEILVNPAVPIASVEIPRALRSRQGAAS
ncbi:MAG: 50S ribosomal protein L25/general stress protein Ctc [Microscillaceae bacterium]